MWFAAVSLFPEMFDAVCQQGVVAKAFEQQLITLKCFNPRDFSQDKHQRVDDRPYGGGPGMLMKVQPLQDAIAAAKREAPSTPRVIYLSPQGKRMDQSGLQSLMQYQSLILVAGRYEGVDERLLETEIDEEWSLGDFVLSGGELAAMVMIDSIARHIPGVLGHSESAKEDSFQYGLLDCPHYTRPANLDGKLVPEVLLSGNHQRIERWRRSQQLGRTWLKRPDLLAKLELTNEQQKLLNEFICEQTLHRNENK